MGSEAECEAFTTLKYGTDGEADWREPSRRVSVMQWMITGESKLQADQAVHRHQIMVLVPNKEKDFQGGGDNGEAEEKPASNSEAESQP